ncbi:hypothetical protein Q5M85_21335 [Paraclostridium bifermentans]|nr:hypothetical protein [Paraclostridium bifermentans]
MSGTIELDGFEEFQEFIEDMSLDIGTKRQAIRSGINVIGKGLEKDTLLDQLENLLK